MDQQALYLELAGRWGRAAHQTTNEVLKACYAERAAKYLDRANSAQAPLAGRDRNDPHRTSTGPCGLQDLDKT
jgi:hypothetical protein